MLEEQFEVVDIVGKELQAAGNSSSRQRERERERERDREREREREREKSRSTGQCSFLPPLTLSSHFLSFFPTPSPSLSHLLRLKRN